MASIVSRITDLVGAEYSTIPSNSSDDLINSAIMEVADSLPNELLLKYCKYKTNITAAGLDAVEEKKILFVTREIADAGLEARECKPVSYDEFLKAQNSTSIYYATVESPVYSYDIATADDPKLKIFPVPTDDQLGYVWHFNYPSSGISTDSTIAGLPDSCLQAVVLKACINILQAYISDFVQDEEDQEMLTMLNAQIQSLQQSYQTEIGRFMDQQAQPKGE